MSSINSNTPPAPEFSDLRTALRRTAEVQLTTTISTTYSLLQAFDIALATNKFLYNI